MSVIELLFNHSGSEETLDRVGIHLDGFGFILVFE